MNIENRLKKLETAANLDSEHCQCSGGAQNFDFVNYDDPEKEV